MGWAWLLKIIFSAIWIFLGGHAIRNTIRFYKSGQFLWCGFCAMCAVVCSAGIFDLYLTN